MGFLCFIVEIVLLRFKALAVYYGEISGSSRIGT